jgi:hypothetical protein
MSAVKSLSALCPWNVMMLGSLHSAPVQDLCVDRAADEFYDTTVTSHTKSPQLFESLHPRYQQIVVHLREYANVVSWSQVPASKTLSQKQAPGKLQNRFLFYALVAVSVHPLPHNVVDSIVWSTDQSED